MKTKLLILFCLVFTSQALLSQLPQDVYRKTLKEVLSDIENRYKIKLVYSESLVKDIIVSYPTWRYRSDIEPTLENILMPLDIIFQKTGENAYRISKYVYNERPVEEGRKHLDRLLASYPSVQPWES
jgi:hypothetical protein